MASEQGIMHGAPVSYQIYRPYMFSLLIAGGVLGLPSHRILFYGKYGILLFRWNTYRFGNGFYRIYHFGKFQPITSQDYYRKYQKRHLVVLSYPNRQDKQTHV